MADFETALQITLSPTHEGGYQNNPQDHANWYNGINYGTNGGITPADVAAYFPELINDPDCVKNLTFEQKAHIYREGYWKSLYSEIQDQNVANKLFDMGVLFGVGEAVKLLQITLQSAYPDIKVDESFGPVTLGYVNGVDSASLLSGYKTALISYALRIAANRPAERIFVAGWGRRINS